MLFYALTFYGFATLMVVSSLLMILSSNAVHSVLYLVFAFLNSAGIYILLGAEFISLSTVIVYIGAVAVLFLFVVMTMETNSPSPIRSLKGYKFVLGIAGAVFLAELLAMAFLWKVKPSISVLLGLEQKVENTRAIGAVLYTDYALIFQASAIILLVAMVGAIVLTFKQGGKKHARRQNSTDQINRDPKKILRMVSKKQWEGI